MQKRIGIVVRDMGDKAMAEPVAVIFRDRGYDVRMFAEEGGLAKTILAQPFTILPQDTNPLRFLREQKPDVVIVGIATYRQLETQIERVARELGIPVVQLENTPGVHVNSPLRDPDLVVTVDDLSAHLLYADGNPNNVVIAGDPGVMPLAESAPLHVQAEFEMLRAGGREVIMIPDDEPDYTDTMRILRESLAMTKTPVRIVPRIRGKHKDQPGPDGKTWGAWIAEQFAPLRDQNLLWEPEGVNTSQLAELPGIIVASGFSTVLRRAMAAGNRTITFWNRFNENLLMEQTGLTETPAMLLGGPRLAYAQPLEQLFDLPPVKVTIEPFDAEVAAGAIEKLLGL